MGEHRGRPSWQAGLQDHKGAPRIPVCAVLRHGETEYVPNRDRQGTASPLEKAATIHQGAKERGLLIARGGIYGNVPRIKPPICITKPDPDFLVVCLDETLSTLR